LRFIGLFPYVPLMAQAGKRRDRRFYWRQAMNQLVAADALVPMLWQVMGRNSRVSS